MAFSTESFMIMSTASASTLPGLVTVIFFIALLLHDVERALALFLVHVFKGAWIGQAPLPRAFAAAVLIGAAHAVA
jgi:hypothetical protein